MLRSSLRRSLVAAAGLLTTAIALQACNSTITDVGVPASPSFTLTLGRGTIPVAQGASATTSIRATRSGGLTTPISFAPINVPTGISAIITGTDVADSATLTVTVTGRIDPGTYAMTVNAVAAGAASRQATVQVAVSVVAGEVPEISFVVAGSHTCALTTEGAAYCWGYNGHGELGNNDTATVNARPVAVSGGLAFQMLAVSHVDGVTCGITFAGAAYCWGQNDGGQLGDASTTDRLTPTPVSGGLTFMSLAVGTAHACGIAVGGAAYCWGTSPNGAFGDGITGTHLTPTLIAPNLTFESIVAGSDYTCAVALGGTAYCWGLGVQGQLGNNTASISSTPVAVAGGLRFRALSAGGMSVCGVTLDEQAYCWGYNFFGTLGDGTLQRRLTPVAVAGGLTFQRVSVGFETTCGLTNLGAGYCWGYNFGALGDGTADHRSTPGAILGGFRFQSISAGTGYSCGVTTDRTVFCWGDNSNGELGDGTTDARETPTLVRWPSG